MSCERYREWIKRSLLDSLDASRQTRLDEHPAECGACCKLLEAESRLLNAINSGLEASVTGLPSPDFFAVLSTRLAAESERARPRPEWVRISWLAAPIAALAVLATLFLAIRPGSNRRAHTHARPTAHATGSTGSTGPAPIPGFSSVAAHNGGALLASDPAQKHAAHLAARLGRTGIRRSLRRKDQAPALRVLVEPGQWREIVAAYRLAQSGHIDTSSVAKASEADQPEEMKPIEIMPVAIAELYPEKPNDHAGR